MAITRYLQIGEEANYGEEASTYAETLDPETVDIDSEDDDKLIYEGMSGLDRLAQVGVYSTSGSITLPVDDLASGWFWKWALGGYNVTGDGSTPYTHEFTPKRGSTMTSFSAKVGKDIFAHIFLGNVIESIELEVENEWALMTVNTLGAKDKHGTLEEQTFTEGNVFTAPMVTLDRDGSDVSPDVSSLSLSVETGANVEDSQGVGSRFPTKAFMGSMVVNLDLTLDFENTDQLTQFWGGDTEPSTDTISEFGYTLHIGENYDISFPRMIYTSSNQGVEGRDAIQQELTARALFDPTNQEGPILVSLTNDKAEYSTGA
ncbi:phage tail tube protein [Halobacillus salinarum]|uniref:Phage tail tube protein n=1 Tax=Halobacillus salinarum TaxID=2932257 RepID=A0ABY4EIM1_9BACI|nr:phage tail tube protein [Halobacillus salinarum]UOQ43352.1 phage tail tube protein [Halobacillus salinarum]